MSGTRGVQLFDGERAFVEKNFPIRFPCIFTEKKGKMPAVKGWNTLSENVFTAADYQKYDGYMVLTGPKNNLTVIDLDNHESNGMVVSGVEWFLSRYQSEMAETFCVRTPRGGYHLYYQHVPELKSETRAVLNMPNVELDIKNDYGNGKGANVTGAGSRGYTIVTMKEPKQMPVELIAQFAKKNEKNEKKARVVGIVDALAGDKQNGTSLDFLNQHLKLQERVDWEYERDDDQKVVKFLSNGLQCLVSNKMHDKPQSAIFMNLASKTAVCNCFGNCGHKMLGKSIYRQIMNGFNLFVMNIENVDTDYRELLKHVLDVGEDNKLKRYNGEIYRQIDGKSYAYEKWLDTKDFMNHFFNTDPLYHGNAQMLAKIKTWIADYHHPRFPLLKRDLRYIGFSNGVLDLEEGGRIIDTETFARDLPDVVCRHYISVEYTEDLETPMFDGFARFQLPEDDVYQMLLTMIGRLFFPVGHKDNWQVFMFVRGEPFSGKSTLSEIIEAMFSEQSVGTINKQFEPVFGYSALFYKELVKTPDLSQQIFERLDPQTMQSMISGERVSCPVKSGTPIDGKWTVPFLWSGNFSPDISTNAGAQTRRWLTFKWTKPKPENERDENLKSKIINNELANLIMKCTKSYYATLQRFTSSFWNSCPEYFRVLRQENMEEGSVILRFLNSDSFKEQYRICQDTDVAGIPVSEFKKCFDQWSLQETGKRVPIKLDDHQGELSQGGVVYLKNVHICKHGRHLHKRGCCDNYSCNDRNVVNYIGNIVAVE